MKTLKKALVTGLVAVMMVVNLAVENLMQQLM